MKVKNNSRTYHPNFKNFEVFYDDATTVYQILVVPSMYGGSGLAAFWAYMVFILGILLAVSIPTAIFIILLGAFSDGFKGFYGVMITQLFFILSALILCKFQSGFLGFFLVFLVTFVMAAMRFAGFFAWVLGLLDDKMSFKKFAHFALVVIANIVWFVVLCIDFSLIFRGFLFYCLMVVVDLLFEGQEKFKESPAWFLWLMLMLEGLINQFSCYSFYTFVFWVVHGEAPSVFIPYFLPDLGLFFLMLIPFYLKSCFSGSLSEGFSGSKSNKKTPKKAPAPAGGAIKIADDKPADLNRLSKVQPVQPVTPFVPVFEPVGKKEEAKKVDVAPDASQGWMLDDQKEPAKGGFGGGNGNDIMFGGGEDMLGGTENVIQPGQDVLGSGNDNNIQIGDLGDPGAGMGIFGGGDANNNIVLE